MNERKTAPCPVNGCAADISLPADLPAGTYDCLCHHTKLRLSWDTYLQGGRQPRLTVDAARPEGESL